MRDPRRFQVFILADELVIEVYRASQRFPLEETYGLTSQVRRSALSVPSNLIEGCSRVTDPDFLRFVRQALGSAMEAGYQLDVAARLGYGVDADLIERYQQLSRQLRALANSLEAPS